MYPGHAEELENNDRSYYDIVSRPTQYYINFQIQDVRDRSYENTTNLIIDCKFLTWINNNITCLSSSIIEVIWNSNHYTCYTFKVPESERRNVRFLSTILYTYRQFSTEHREFNFSGTDSLRSGSSSDDTPTRNDSGFQFRDQHWTRYSYYHFNLGYRKNTARQTLQLGWLQGGGCVLD